MNEILEICLAVAIGATSLAMTALICVMTYKMIKEMINDK